MEVPPPGTGLNTVMSNIPAVVKLLDEIVAVSCVLLMKDVVRFEPLKLTTDPDMKFVPITVMVKPESPTVLLVGEMLIKVGMGLSTGRTVNV